MIRKPLPLQEEDDNALMERIAAVAQEQGLPSLTPTPTQTPAYETRPLKPLKLMVPDYLFRELAINAATNGVTRKYLILKALQNAGYRVDPEDLEEDGRRVR